jgi:hypothetical protein
MKIFFTAIVACLLASTLFNSNAYPQALEQVDNNFRLFELNEAGLSPSIPSSPNQASEELIAQPLVSVKEKAEKIALDPYNSTVETTLFDVYLGDKLKGAILADYTDQWLEITTPQDLIDQMSDLKGAQRLMPLISGKLIEKREILDVGAIKYDLNTFSIRIDVTPEFLGLTTLDLNKRVKNPVNAPSLQQRLSVVTSGSTQGGSKGALAHRGIASYGTYNAVLDGALVDNEPYEVTQATVGGIFGDYRATGGLLQTPGSNFAGSLQYAGIKVETAEELFLDQDLIRGSRFEVFVPSRSRVEFYRDGRLISVQVLDFGLREVDTTSFPQGSYDVDIVIIDSFGSSTRQRKFFTKAGFLASRNQPIYTLQAGTIRDELDSIDKPVYQGGVRFRASDIFDLDTSVYGSEDLTIGTIETIGLYREFRFGLGLNQSSQGDSGVNSNFSTDLYGFNLNLSHTDTIHGGESRDVVDPVQEEPFDPVFNLKKRDDRLIFLDRYSNSYGIGRRMGPTNLRYISEESSGDGTPKHYSRGPYFEWNIIENTIQTLRFQVSTVDTEQGQVDNAGMLFAYRISDNFVIATQLSRIGRDNGDETLLLTSLNYDEKDKNRLGSRGILSNEIRNKDKKEKGAETSITNQANLTTTGEYLETIGFVRDTRTDQTDNSSYGVSATSSFLMASDLSVSVSHPVTQEAVFIAEVASNSTESVFEILMNGQVAGTVTAGGKTTIGVSPYRTYDIKLRPKEGEDLVSYDSNTTTVTFFPGNVIKRKWQADKVFIILGRIIDENGDPVARQRIKGTKEYTATEEDGTFQAEIGGTETLTIETHGYQCKLSFDIPADQQYFLDLGDLPCINEEKNTSPKKQP